MRDHIVLFGQGTGASIYFKLGWPPALVRISNFAARTGGLWCPLIPEEDAIEDAAAGTKTLDTSHGVRLVKFNDEPGALPGSGGTPSDVENGRFWEANGIELTSGVVANIDGEPFCIEAFRMTVPMVTAVHDGTNPSHTYFEDSSIDFIEAGISPNGKFILINETNDNMAYVGAITQPAGKTNYCRIYTFEDEGLVTATAAAAFATDDVVYILPRAYSQHPLITAAT